MSASTGTGEYERLLATCRDLDPVRTAVVDPCQKPALIGADGAPTLEDKADVRLAHAPRATVSTTVPT